MRPHLLTVFGATGLSARATLTELVDGPAARWLPGFTWAIAGRNRAALEHIRASLVRDKSTLPLPEIIVADVHDEASLVAMTRKTQLLLNCVGPYSQFGEPVVRACIETSTDYLDLSGEPGFIERMHLLYHDAAVKAGITIIQAAAFDSVPCDLGVVFCKKLLAEQGAYPSSVEMVFTLEASMTNSLNYATYESAIHGFSSTDALQKDRKELARVRPAPVPIGPTPPPNDPSFLLSRWNVTRDARTGGYLVPFFFSDPAVVRLSQVQTRHVIQAPNAPTPAELAPVHFVAHVHLATLRSAIRYVAHFPLFQWLAVRAWGRRLLHKHPNLFTGGLVGKGTEPDESLHEGLTFTQTYYARGYSMFPPSPPSMPPDVTVTLKIHGTEPAYGATALIFLEVASVLLRRRSAVRKGVLTPAVALGHLDTHARRTEVGEGGVMDALQRDGRIMWSVVDVRRARRRGGGARL